MSIKPENDRKRISLLIIGLIIASLIYFVLSFDWDQIIEKIESFESANTNQVVYIEEPVYEEDAELMTVQVYFSNFYQNKDMIDCSLVYPVERVIPFRKAVETAALNELLRGISMEESNDGFYSNIPVGTIWNSVDITNGVARVDFNDKLDEGVGGSCWTEAIRSQIEATLKQFDSVNEVIISINGDSELILQP